MDPRIRSLLSWQLRFQSRRMATWLFGAGYVLFALALISMAPTRFRPGIPPGTLQFTFLKSAHVIAAVFFAIWAAGQSTDDTPSGTLGFLKIASLSSRSWVTFRFLAALLAFLPIWILRLPLYSLAFSLGGVTVGQILWLEAVQWVVFLSITCLALLVARYVATGPGLATLTLLFLSLWQAVLNSPRMGLFLLSLFPNQPIDPSMHEWAQVISELALIRHFWTFPTSLREWIIALASFALHLALGAYLLRTLARLLYINVGTEMTGEPDQNTSRQGSLSRPSRRVSDDPLAWQVCHVHTWASRQSCITTTVVLSACVLLVAFGAIPHATPRSIVIGVACGLTVIIAAFKPSDCLARELRGKTLSTLSLLPLDGREIFEGWRRGAWQLARPACVAVAAGCAVLCLLVPVQAPWFMMVIVLSLLLLPEAAFLSNLATSKDGLLNFNFTQLLVSFWCLVLTGVVLAISLPIAVYINIWAGVATSVGTSLLARQVLLLDFAGYFSDRVQGEQ